MEEVTNELQVFYDDLVAGKKPMLIIEAPPQHGKSDLVKDFIAWLAGKDPSKKTIYASFSERLGVRANLSLQRLYTRKVYRDIFPYTSINEKNVVTGTNYLRNREILEYINQDGYFRNTTVQGSITGESLDLGVIDDPLKGREAANSQTVRDKTWEWFTDDFFTRFSEDAGFLMILTRWHIDDPAARLIKNNPRIKVLKYKALAEQDEDHRMEGEALIPEHKSKEFLQERKSIMGVNFEALYQQNPVIKGGNKMKLDWFRWWTVLPHISHLIITVDTAQKTKEQNDFTVMECWAISKEKDIYLLDMLRGKFEAPQLRKMAKIFYTKWNDSKIGSLRKMYIEDKSSGSSLIQDFKADKMKIGAVQRNTDKVFRCDDLSPHIEAGRVYLNENIKGIEELISEAVAFPNGKHDDCHPYYTMIDTPSGQKRIEDIKPNDTILTLLSNDYVYANVKSVIMSGEKEILKFYLSNGDVIESSLNHPYMTNKGWKRANNIDISNTKILKVAQWKKYTKEKDLLNLENIFYQLITLMEKEDGFTNINGKKNTREKYQKALRYIILTTIDSIIQLKILNYYQKKSILRGILKIIASETNLISNLNILKRLDLLQLWLKKDCMKVKTNKERKELLMEFIRNVSNASKNSNLILGQDLTVSFVHHNVESNIIQLKEESLALSLLVSSVEKNLQENIKSNFAPNIVGVKTQKEKIESVTIIKKKYAKRRRCIISK